MKTSLFHFELPESFIADRPAQPRDSARMLVGGEAFADKTIRDFPDFLKAGDVLVLNDTRVIPARLWGVRGNLKIQILLHRRLSSPLAGAEFWECMVKPGKRLAPGDEIALADGLSATVLEKMPDGQVHLQFEGNLREHLKAHGQMPLPPYIGYKRQHAGQPRDAAQDSEDYQTVYARHDGSIAAPTAGLHFTEELLAAIRAKGVAIVRVTLHVGVGTFAPVRAEDTKDHAMHGEWAQLTKETADAINAAREKGGRVIAVGSTSLRTLETAAREDGTLAPFEGDTHIFITPGYRFKCVDMLLTNFHLPCSTLFMLVSAFSGLERMHAAYAHAMAQQYRFYSYGDACLLYKQS